MRKFFPLFLALLMGCGTTDLALPELSEAEAVAGFQDSGLSEGAANCVVGLGQSQFDLDDLTPVPDDPEVSTAIVDFTAACQRAEDLMNAVPEQEVTIVSDQPFAYGDDTALDGLWDLCDSGQGFACDELWTVAPLDSDYEEFGVTCGNRPEILECSKMVDLD